MIRGRAFALAAALSCAGCAFGNGEPFGELEATLDARYALVEDRDAGDGWQKLDNDFEIRVDSLELEVLTIDLEDTGGGAEGDFDPSNPPAGYTLCHNGHCHRDDGALVPYEDIAAGGGAATATLVAALPIGTLDLAAGVSRPLDCAESCQLPRAHIGRARMYAQHFEASGEVRDGRAEPRLTGNIPWTVSTVLGVTDADRTGLIDAALDVPIDRDLSPLVHVDLALHAGAKLLDSVAFHEVSQALGGAQPLDLAAHPASLERIAENFAETELTATVTRRDD